MQQKILDLLLDKDEVSWKTIIFDLVKTEQMDPWHIDISLLTKRFIQVIKEMKEHEFKISGKVLLAAAILLKIKATHLIDNDISNLDKLINQTEDDYSEEELFEELGEDLRSKNKQKYQLIPRNPQPRNRKVSVHDLVDALQRAMSTKKKILARQRPVKFTHDYGRKIDILEVIREMYHKINYYTKKEKKDKLAFSNLLPPQAGKREKVYTFIPVLHLENLQKINTTQKEPFDEIYIKLLGKGKVK